MIDDFNLTWFKDTNYKINLTALLTNFKMNQIVNGTTNVAMSSESCIDLICVPTQLETHHHGIIFNDMHNGIIWHNFVYISVNTSPSKIPRKIIYKRNFTNFNEDNLFKDALETITNIMPGSTNEYANNLV